MRPITALFRRPGKKFVPFLTAGYPTLDSTVELVLAAEQAGVHMVELGMPFSDPLADGPVIQQSSQIAIRNGVNLEIILRMVRDVRETSEIPIVLMGYLNPIHRFGLESFLSDAHDAGVNGLILPDLPPEEGTEIFDMIKSQGMSPILLVAPNTKPERITRVGALAGDLLYAVSILGVTGSALNTDNGLSQYLGNLRKYTGTPFVVGFGISTPQDVRRMAALADGVVVGSALIKRIESSANPVQAAQEYLSELVAALPQESHSPHKE
ncbi:MAG TPA: tryptophan synthase subunit alpha [bacterium]|nr:tryptophan synthase subunit alpha [bacterium]